MIIDLLLGLWIAAIAVLVFAIIPALAMGRPAGRASWWPDMLGAAVWTVLTVIILVPPLARLHLLNWVTALMAPLASPACLWLCRHRGALSRAFRALCRRSTLRILMWIEHRRSAPPIVFSARFAGSAVLALVAVAFLLWTTARELRFSSPADYDVLAHTNALLAGGHAVFDPAASVAAVVTRLAAVDPMQTLRFLKPLTVPGSIVAFGLQTSSLNAAFGWTAIIAAVLLSLVALGGVHRRDGWHGLAACAIAMLSFSAANRAAARADGVMGRGGYVEYDAAPRQALRIARDFADRPWMIVAPPEQRVEVADPHRFMALADFVRRFGDRAGDRRFRFALPGRDLFVFVERNPLSVDPGAALTPARYSSTAAGYGLYRMPNARARLEALALDLCERYRRTHARTSVYYEDANLRIYRFQTLAPQR
ncbi:MAG TPA: hypothetical protein VGQ16_09695 [Vicinamibacterales bacterium]|jgi:hypothetical protein|nr:hypothetical protein [Vicinamibacterales bacterium]